MIRPGFVLVAMLLLVLAFSIFRLTGEGEAEELTDVLEVPDNIDYYLNNVDYRVHNEQGELAYQLQAPRLEHYIREDISRIQNPLVHYNSGQSQLLLSALLGQINHSRASMTLRDNVLLQKQGNDSNIQMRSDHIVLLTEQDILQFPGSMRLSSAQLDLTAAQATVDGGLQRITLKQVKATYRGGSHES